MPAKPKIYDSYRSRAMALKDLVFLFESFGVTRVVYKHLAPNDNSKNQPYLAGHFSDLSFMPTGEMTAFSSTSGKTKDPKRQVRYQAALNLSWVSAEGTEYPAPAAKLIYYPQFPEVRLSGFLQGSQFDMGGWMDPSKSGRSPGRILFFGIGRGQRVFCFLTLPGSIMGRELEEARTVQLSNVLMELPLSGFRRRTASVHDAGNLTVTRDLFETLAQRGFHSDIGRAELIAELARIHRKGVIPGKKLRKNGMSMPYRARNGGGYTLEAELGISPNGVAEPDFHGWEVKQFAVKRFDNIDGHAITLMTPEPDGGVYKEQGAESFIRTYGYESTRTPDRLDFTGRHFADTVCDKSSLRLVLSGYDSSQKTITDGSGFIGLIDNRDNIAASWGFAKLIGHWKTKHANAAYIPSIAHDIPGGGRGYFYGKNVRLYSGTDIIRLLRAVSDKTVYYDPGIKLENISVKPKIKKRSQFRVSSSSLAKLYESMDAVDVTK